MDIFDKITKTKEDVSNIVSKTIEEVKEDPKPPTKNETVRMLKKIAKSLDKIVPAKQPNITVTPSKVMTSSPNVNVKAPDVHIFPEIRVPKIKIPEAVVTVNVPKAEYPKKWVFKISRNSGGFIDEIVAEREN